MAFPPQHPLRPTGRDGKPLEEEPVIPSKLAVAALAAAPLLLPLTVTNPAAAAGAATVQTATPHHSRHWYHCHTSARPCAWHRPAPRVTATSGARVRLMRVARTYLGVPYRSGGTSHAGVDCSGLVVAVYRQAFGQRLPRTTGALAAAGRYVARAQVGDILVYAGAGHVALVSAVTSTGRVAMTLVARHSGTSVQYQRPYTSYTVRAYVT